jgi:hypothetical protein
MAAPVIDSVTPPNATLSPGQFIDVVVAAHDPDSASGSVKFPVADTQGNTTEASILLVLNDPLTFSPALNPNGLNVTIQRITAAAVNPATYRVTAN